MLTAGAVTEAAANRYVLHVVPANGGGVDRCVRDICARRSHDCILHAAYAQTVFEAVAAQRLIALDRTRMTDDTFGQSFGKPSLVHAHSTLPPVRDAVRSLCQSPNVNYVLTLHDIDFASTSVDIGRDEREARLAFVRNAHRRIVPSEFISGMLSTALGSGTTRQRIENGVDTGTAVSKSAPDPAASVQFQVAVVGALGQHKGLNFLTEVVAALPSEIRVAIIGYADGQLTPGWLMEDRLWVHGAFEPSGLAGIVERYGSTIAFFPNRQAESYCYALSDAWCAGLPALGPASGAIGERIAQTGAGWTFPPDSAAAVVACKILDCLRETNQTALAVRRAAASLMSAKAMVDQLNLLYETVMNTPDAPAQLRALEATAATHLNGQFFRAELQKLSGDIAFSQVQAINATQALQALTREYEGRGAWIATLEKNFADAQLEIQRIETARKNEYAEAEAARQNERAQTEAARQHERAQAEAARLYERAQAEAARLSAASAHAAHEQYAAKLLRDVTDTLAVAHRQERTIAVYERALSIIPPTLRRWMLRRAERPANTGESR